jgi:phosphate transport system substrate-binding protein
MKLPAIFSAAILICLAGAGRAEDVTDEVSRELPNYQPLKTPLKGEVVSCGSTILANMLNRWAVGFRKAYPAVEVTVSSTASSDAPAILMAGKCNLAAMSRRMTEEEIAAFTKKLGYPPTRVVVGVDAIAIFVEKNNPIASMSMTEIDSVFSRTFNRGGKPVRKWGELGIKGKLQYSEVARYGTDKVSGAVEIFKQRALLDGDFSLQFNYVHGASSVVQGIGADPAGIGIATAILETQRTRRVPIRMDDGSAVEPSYENVVNGKYPLSRMLQFYVNKPPEKELDTITLELLKYALSEDGQQLVAHDGNYPLTPALAAEQLKALGVTK